MEPLLVCKELEKPGMIGPLLIHEAVGLLIGSLLSFVALKMARDLWQISLWWFVTTPALLFLALILLKALRKGTNPTLFFSFISYHLCQPKHITLKQPYYVAKAARNNPSAGAHSPLRMPR